MGSISPLKKPQRAATYLRSSKDRSDVSIDAQRRQLTELAQERGFVLVEEFSDVVESGKDEHRPGFQRLLGAVRNRRRGWDTLLLLDTSRLARRRHISLVFEEIEARKHGVRVVYKSLPDSDPITEMLLKSILQAMDEWHSLTSRQKGLAGMTENVRQGWRAGGRAPIGYQLHHVETGAQREGVPVRKSKLVPSDDASRVGKYLKLRAKGETRSAACQAAGLSMSASSLVGVEWNALTYAGHTVWNVRYEHGPGGFGNGVKRRPRNEWIIQRDTHPALIDDDEAEALITRLESFDRGHHSRGDYILTGLLVDPQGNSWRGCDGGDGGYYRLGKGKRIKAAIIEGAIIRQVAQDLQSEEFLAAVALAHRKAYEKRKADDSLPGLRKEAADLERRIKRITEMLPDTRQPEPLLRQMEEHEVRRVALEEEIAQREQDELDARKVNNLTQLQVSRVAAELIAGGETLDRQKLRVWLASLVQNVHLDPSTGEASITYNVTAVTGLRVASPRGSESKTGFRYNNFKPKAA